MKAILWNLRKSLLDLFPTNKFRLVLISLILIAAFISVSELALAKLFTQIILHEDTIEKNQLILLLIGFFLFYGFTRAGQFAQRLYRLRLFDKAFKAKDGENTAISAKENWRWSQALELTNISSTLTQLAVIISFFFYLNWQFALVTLFSTLLVLEILGRLFSKQISAQRGFAKARKNKVKISNAIKVRTRIKSGEVGTLWAGFAMILMLAALLYLNYIDEISAQNTVVIFFGLRMQNSSLSSISTSLMRFARAKTHGE